jgi:AraC family transcriptional regulator
MNKLLKGEYYGQNKQKSIYDELIITDTEYTHAKVDWHYHENPYFTYLLQGKLYEANKKNDYHLGAGSLLFHNWQDAHYNVKPPEFTRGFHIELNADWFKKYNLTSFNFEGSIHLQNPLIKSVMNQIFMESKKNDVHSKLSIDILLLDIFNKIQNKVQLELQAKPKWVELLKEIINEEPETCSSLPFLAKQLNIHPVHLSREFSKYFDSTLGQYLRNQKVNNAALLISQSDAPLTEIGYECGFYDQSHFISNFKRLYGLTPLKFRKSLR